MVFLRFWLPRHVRTLLKRRFWCTYRAQWCKRCARFCIDSDAAILLLLLPRAVLLLLLLMLLNVVLCATVLYWAPQRVERHYHQWGRWLTIWRCLIAVIGAILHVHNSLLFSVFFCLFACLFFNLSFSFLFSFVL